MSKQWVDSVVKQRKNPLLNDINKNMEPNFKQTKTEEANWSLVYTWD